MKLAVTGAAGFLGQHICHAFSDNYDEIVALDIEAVNPDEYQKNIRYFNIDVRDPGRLKEALKGADCVVHAAAALPLWKRRDIFDINVAGTRNVLDISRMHGINRVVFISSTAVYGIPEKHPVYEDNVLIGAGPYGESKIAAEKVCGEYRQHGMCIPVVRPKTFIGVGRFGVFQILYDWVESGKRIPIIGSGKNRYQLLEVEDLVNAVYLLLTGPQEKANNTFNVGAERFSTVFEDVKALCDYAATGASVLPTPAYITKAALSLFEKMGLSPLYKWVYGTADKDSYVSIERIKSMFGWVPKYSNAQSLIRSYQWYLEHKDKVSREGITHHVPWKQGILKLFKKVL